MHTTIPTALKLIAGSEGGFVNNPKDPGGATMRGVTLAVYQQYCALLGKKKPGIAELKKITLAEVEDIFVRNYWNGVRGDDLPVGLDYAAADFAFNSGSGQAVKDLQRVVTALGFDTQGIDGKIGDFTLEAIRKAMASVGSTKVINVYMDRRLAFMKGLSTWGTFGKGWTNRVAAVRAAAIKLAAGHPTVMVTDAHENTVAAAVVEDAKAAADPTVAIAVATGAIKANPEDTTLTATPGGKSVIATVGGAIATAVASAAPKILDLGSNGVDYLPWAVGGFVVLTLVGAVITAVVIHGRPKREGVV